MTWMRGIKRSKPLKRSTKAIPRGARPRSSVPSRTGTFRQKVQHANELWRQLIYKRARTTVCPRCLARPWKDAAHGFIKGRYPQLRFDLDNGIALCRTCHQIIDSDHLAKVELWVVVYGRRAYDRLELMAQARAKTDIDLTIMSLEVETARAAENAFEWAREKEWR